MPDDLISRIQQVFAGRISVSRRELAFALNISIPTIDRELNRGRWQSYQDGRARRIPVSSVIADLELKLATSKPPSQSPESALGRERVAKRLIRPVAKTQRPDRPLKRSRWG